MPERQRRSRLADQGRSAARRHDRGTPDPPRGAPLPPEGWVPPAPPPPAGAGRPRAWRSAAVRRFVPASPRLCLWAPAARLGPADFQPGLGTLSVLPPGEAGWNWGAFLFTWIWGLGNGAYITLWGLLLFLGPSAHRVGRGVRHERQPLGVAGQALDERGALSSNTSGRSPRSSCSWWGLPCRSCCSPSLSGWACGRRGSSPAGSGGGGSSRSARHQAPGRRTA